MERVYGMETGPGRESLSIPPITTHGWASRRAQEPVEEWRALRGGGRLPGILYLDRASFTQILGFRIHIEWPLGAAFCTASVTVWAGSPGMPQLSGVDFSSGLGECM